MAKKPEVKKVDAGYRSAVTGQKVTEQYAKSHPKTTVHETQPAPKPKGKKR